MGPPFGVWGWEQLLTKMEIRLHDLKKDNSEIEKDNSEWVK